MNGRENITSQPFHSASTTLFLAALILLGAQSAADARNIEIAPSDELQKAADNLQPGDTLRLAPGEYHRPIVIQAKGTEIAPIRTINPQHPTPIAPKGPKHTSPSMKTVLSRPVGEDFRDVGQSSSF
jgi:hypothetical protein